MNTIIKNRKVRAFIVKTSDIINDNTGLLIVVAIVFFGLSNQSFLKDNEVLLENTASTAKNSNQAVKDLKKLLCEGDTPQEDCAIVQAVSDLKADNLNQTNLIICILAIHGESTAISQTDEERCRVLVAQTEATGARPEPTTTDPSSTSKNKSSNGNSGGNNNGNNPPPASRNPLIDATDLILDNLYKTVDGLSKLIQ